MVEKIYEAVINYDALKADAALVAVAVEKIRDKSPARDLLNAARVYAGSMAVSSALNAVAGLGDEWVRDYAVREVTQAEGRITVRFEAGHEDSVRLMRSYLVDVARIFSRQASVRVSEVA